MRRRFDARRIPGARDRMRRIEHVAMLGIGEARVLDGVRAQRRQIALGEIERELAGVEARGVEQALHEHRQAIDLPLDAREQHRAARGHLAAELLRDPRDHRVELAHGRCEASRLVRADEGERPHLDQVARPGRVEGRLELDRWRS